ncbi:MAG: hypothetical protein M3Y28_09040 [Armatimonadota bacterium]|nr:hypothetical protein [Armatimonadota bacterium]
MSLNLRYVLVLAGVALALSGCASQEKPKAPMTQAQAQQQLRTIANDPTMSKMAREAAQQGLDESQAQNSLGGDSGRK